MKVTRISFMVLGMAFLMFVVTSAASAQPYFVGEWFKGKISFKGYEITATDVDKNSGSAPIYVNLVQDADFVTVTTCIRDRDDKDVYHRASNSTTIPKTSIYFSAEGNLMIWDFTVNYIEFYGPAYAYPTFTAKINGSETKVNFKTIACTAYDETGGGYAVGSCSINFQNVDNLKVPEACLPAPL